MPGVIFCDNDPACVITSAITPLPDNGSVVCILDKSAVWLAASEYNLTQAATEVVS
jgi:hypothetical protein